MPRSNMVGFRLLPVFFTAVVMLIYSNTVVLRDMQAAVAALHHDGCILLIRRAIRLNAAEIASENQKRQPDDDREQ